MIFFLWVSFEFFSDVLLYLYTLFTPKSLHNATNVVVKLLGKEMWTKQK